jgi:hypothetical protein
MVSEIGSTSSLLITRASPEYGLIPGLCLSACISSGLISMTPCGDSEHGKHDKIIDMEMCVVVFLSAVAPTAVFRAGPFSDGKTGANFDLATLLMQLNGV